MSEQPEALRLAKWLDAMPSSGYALTNQAAAELRRLHEENERLKAAVQGEPVTVLPDGSAFAVMSWPLPKDHWLYAERQYKDGADEPVELGKPILTHELRDAVVSAVRYAIRGATNCGKEIDFDPDALVQNVVYAICGPYGQAYTTPQPAVPERKPWAGLTDAQIGAVAAEIWGSILIAPQSYQAFARAIEVAVWEKLK